MQHTIQVYSARTVLIVKFLFLSDDNTLFIIDVTKYGIDSGGAAALFPDAMDYVTSLLKEMRSWVEDCAADEEDLQDIQEAAAAVDILRYVEREYNTTYDCRRGGIAAFVKEYDAMHAA